MSLLTGSEKEILETGLKEYSEQLKSKPVGKFVSMQDPNILVSMTLSDFEQLRVKFPSMSVVAERTTSGERKYAVCLDAWPAGFRRFVSAPTPDGPSTPSREATPKT